MSNEVIVALIAATPPALASVLWFLAHRRLRRSVGASPEIPLAKLITGIQDRFEKRFDRVENRLDHISEVQSEQGERHHYILGEVGARVVAATQGLDLRTIKQRMERDLYLMLNPRLDHLLEVNDFFVRLIKECRNTPDYDLTRWWGERRCATAIPTPVRPDGLGRLSSFGKSCTFGQAGRRDSRFDRRVLLGEPLAGDQKGYRSEGLPWRLAYRCALRLSQHPPRSGRPIADMLRAIGAWSGP